MAERDGRKRSVRAEVGAHVRARSVASTRMVRVRQPFDEVKHRLHMRLAAPLQIEESAIRHEPRARALVNAGQPAILGNREMGRNEKHDFARQTVPTGVGGASATRGRINNEIIVVVVQQRNGGALAGVALY